MKETIHIIIIVILTEQLMIVLIIGAMNAFVILNNWLNQLLLEINVSLARLKENATLK
jgi:hypothetical protein